MTVSEGKHESLLESAASSAENSGHLSQLSLAAGSHGHFSHLVYGER